MVQKIKLTAIISNNQFGKRLDQVLAKMFPNYSRSCIKEWILNKGVLVNGEIWNKPRKKVSGGEIVNINTEAKVERKTFFKAQSIPLNIIYEDDDILIINKPYNLLVHPGAGNLDGTLLNALLHYYPPIANVPRAGIVHRLDKDTTGLMVVAKTILAQTKLVKLFQLHTITREYEAIVIGRMITGGTVNELIGRHPTKRTHMSLHPMGKFAVTHYRIVERFRVHTHLRVYLETGRTHQIRVHMAHINHPLIGDQVYGDYLHLPKRASQTFIDALRKFNRQALHATTLGFNHPLTGSRMKWYEPIPQDMENLIKIMSTDCKEHQDSIN